MILHHCAITVVTKHSEPEAAMCVLAAVVQLVVASNYTGRAISTKEPIIGLFCCGTLGLVMNIKTIKTKKFSPPKESIEDLFQYLGGVKNGEVVAISSKVIAICQGRCLAAEGVDKEQLVRKNASLVLVPEQQNRAHMELTQVEGHLVESAGIDRSNGAGYFILMPKRPYLVAQHIWSELRKRNNLQNVGVIITDSHSEPMRKGALGLSLGSYGFYPVSSYTGQQDIFGQNLQGAGANIEDSLAVAAVLSMGEGNEMTPIAIITGALSVRFYQRMGIVRQRAMAYVSRRRDVYGPLLSSRLWRRRKKSTLE